MDFKESEFLTTNIKEKENVLKELFGSLKFENTEEILRETRKDLEGK